MLSYELRNNLDTSLPLGAMISLDELKRGKTRKLHEVSDLADILDKHVFWEQDVFFFSELFCLYDPSIRTTDAVREAFVETVRELRSIGLYEKGRLDDMKRFCQLFNKLLCQAAWNEIHGSRGRRGLAA